MRIPHGSSIASGKCSTAESIIIAACDAGSIPLAYSWLSSASLFFPDAGTARRLPCVGSIAPAFNLENISLRFNFPETDILDRKGVIQRKFLRAVDWTEQEVIDFLAGMQSPEAAEGTPE